MYVALNISASNIKVLSLKGRQVKRWNSLDLSDGMVRDGLILQPQAVGEAINSLFKSISLPRDRVITSIAGLSFTYRFINLPRMKPALVEEAILRAARKEISLPLDELYLSWQAIPGKGEEQSYFILGVPRNLVDTAVQTLKIASVPPYLMDLRPLALARTAQRRDAIIVNLEPDCFDIVFITGGLPTVIHTISPRGKGATLEDNIRRLADELTKTAAFYLSNHPDVHLSPTTPLLLTGTMATETPASGLLQSEVEYPIEALVPPAEYPKNLPVSSYAATIGLALKKTPPKAPPRGEHSRFFDIDVNILAGKHRKPKAKPVRAGYVWLSVVLAILVVLLFPLYQARAHLKTDNINLEDNLNNVHRELNLATIADEDTVNAENSIRQIAAAAAAVKAADLIVLGTRGDFTTGLRLVTGVIPPKTYFTSIEIRQNDIVIQGVTDSVFTVVAYATALENEKTFSEVRITSLDEATLAVAGTGETGTPSETSIVTFGILINKIGAGE
jgi:Tfp pilus assembly PilM family ATPase/Tfp pilus assembly protein PilN